jgi:hypothetical protein
MCQIQYACKTNSLSFNDKYCFIVSKFNTHPTANSLYSIIYGCGIKSLFYIPCFLFKRLETVSKVFLKQHSFAPSLEGWRVIHNS